MRWIQATAWAGFRIVSWAMLGLSCLGNVPLQAQEAPGFQALAQRYAKDITPLMDKYCNDCHSGEKPEADLNLETFLDWGKVRKHPKEWQKIGEMLDSAQMPPKDSAQLEPDERTRLVNWVHDYLKLEAQATAGDPGRVVLRRLSNAEYTYTLRDLTGITTLDPAREFPVDGAAGEGFTNTGNALVMSPALVTKYLDAGKEVAQHVVLLPDGFRFSPHTTRRDWTNDTLDRIRAFYREYSDAQGGDKVNLQGIVFNTNEGGRLPVEKYLLATVMEREAMQSGTKTLAQVAREQGLNAKYLGMLWKSLTSTEPSLLLDGLRRRWKSAKPEDIPLLSAEVHAWQKGLWKFTTVGHIGKKGGPKAWQEAVNPLVSSQAIKHKITTTPDSPEVIVSLVTSDAGDGHDLDFVLWQQPRLVAPGRPDLLLKDVRPATRVLHQWRQSVLAKTAKYLEAAQEAEAAQGLAKLDELAQKYELDPAGLTAWLNYLGIGTGGSVEITGLFTNKLDKSNNYDFIKGWGSHETPLLVANSSDQHVRVPGNMKPHGVAMHPSPTLRVAVGWKCPVTAKFRVEGKVQHAHPECGNGVTWFLEHRRGAIRQQLASGIAQGSREVPFGPLENQNFQAGDVVSLLVGPRDANHSCDLTAVDLKLTAGEGDQQAVWDLAGDVSGDVLAGNPHADRQGHDGVWHFYTEPEQATQPGVVIPAGSLLAQWRTADIKDKPALAEKLQALLTGPAPQGNENPDLALHRQLVSLSGALFRGMLGKWQELPVNQDEAANSDKSEWGLDPALFGRHPDGRDVDPASLCVRAPSILEIRFPTELVEGCELVTTGILEPETGKEGSAQLHVMAGRAPRSEGEGLQPSTLNVNVVNGVWTSNNQQTSYSTPILVNEGSEAHKRLETALEDFRQLFPAALCYTKIVPVDEVVTLTLFYREDDQLQRLMLDDTQRAELNRLWDELHYVSQDALTLVDAFAQLMEYATQDADPRVFEPLRQPINDRAAAYRKLLVDTEPIHLDKLAALASQVYRRPLTENETRELRDLYARLRQEELGHEDAFRLTLARVLVAPAFLYRIEKPSPGTEQAPVSDHELANRLSYFLWSSMPDQELLDLAAKEELHDPKVLIAQAHRMLKNEKTRRLAIEFGCQWLHIHDFENLDEKSERHFPTFAAVRGPMYEESIRFFTDLFQNNGTVLQILDADYTFLNEDLAKHYGIPGVAGPEWRRVDGVKQHSRGGILAQGTTLATQSGASRTSPILRGNWISEVLLGERLPRPPKGVPQLPDDEAATEGLTVRQLVEKHASDPKCAVCHRRIDPFGFSLEGFDAIGRKRDKDLGDRAIDTRVKAIDGAEFDGLAGLQNYLLTVRREAFVRQFCKKLLGFALGRAVQLSDELLLTEMQNELKAHNYQVVTAIEVIVRSRQFLEIRGRDTAFEE